MEGRTVSRKKTKNKKTKTFKRSKRQENEEKNRHDRLSSKATQCIEEKYHKIYDIFKTIELF